MKEKEIKGITTWSKSVLCLLLSRFIFHVLCFGVVVMFVCFYCCFFLKQNHMFQQGKSGKTIFLFPFLEVTYISVFTSIPVYQCNMSLNTELKKT